MNLFKSVLFLMLAGSTTQVDVFKKEMVPLQNAVDSVATGSGARIMSNSKATYLEGYGVVVVMEVMLDNPSNPFSGATNREETRKTVKARQQDLTVKLSDLLKDKTGKTESVGPSDSLTLIVHILNSNPVDVPDLPTQLVISLKKSATQPVVRAL
jgi:hypothetical protein